MIKQSIFIISLVSLAIPALAQDCVSMEQRLAALAKKIKASPVPTAELLVSSLNRLGYGVNPRSSLNPVALARIESSRGRAEASEFIADSIRSSFRNADRMSASVNDVVGAAYPGTYGPGFEGSVAAISRRFKTLKASGGAPFAAYASDLKRAIIARKVLAALTVRDHNVGEVLGDFWFNHFNVSEQKLRAPSYEIEIRRRVCSTFADMLLATARHPAMLSFLNNAENRAGAINENYAREIIELHTLGSGPVVSTSTGAVERVYKQEEVFEAARVLSGWRASDTSGFRFDAALHDKGTKKFPLLFGNARTFTAGDESEGLGFIQALANHPRTKRNLCRKLTTFLLGGKTTYDLLLTCIDAYGTDGDLKAMYTAILVHPDFWNKDLSLAGFKTPFEFLMSADRALGLVDLNTLASDPADLRFFVGTQAWDGLEKMGQPIFRIGPPTGYYIGRRVWNSPAMLNHGLTQVFRATPYVHFETKALTGTKLSNIALERELMNALWTPAQMYNFVTRHAMPIFASPETLPEISNVLEVIEKKRFDHASGTPLPLRTLATQLTSSASFLKK